MTRRRLCGAHNRPHGHSVIVAPPRQADGQRVLDKHDDLVRIALDCACLIAKGYYSVHTSLSAVPPTLRQTSSVRASPARQVTQVLCFVCYVSALLTSACRGSVGCRSRNGSSADLLLGDDKDRPGRESAKTAGSSVSKFRVHSSDAL